MEVEYEDDYSSISFEILKNNDKYNFDGKYLIKLGDKYLSKCFDSDDVELVDELSEYAAEMYWTFIAVEKREATFCYYDHHYIMYTVQERNNFINNFSSFDYTTNTIRNLSNAQYILDYLTEDDIFIYAGYGSDSSIEVCNSLGIKTSAIIADYEVWDESNEYYLDYYPNELAESRCVLLVASQTGTDVIGADGSTYNLVDTIYSYGAHFVLGFTCNMEQEQINAWLNAFFSATNNSNFNNNINDAVEYANSNCGYSVTTYTRGDGDQFINF